MGTYLNPGSMSKEAWLALHGEQQATVPVLDKKAKTIPVCLVDNGLFTAAAIATDDREMQAFTQPSDLRPKIWYLVPKDILVKQGILPLTYLI